ncbi:MAG: AAA family ATPase [Candidatus Omnitrophota bacterium]
MKFFRKMIFFWQQSWVIIVVITVITGLITWAVIGLTSLESFYRNQILATMPVWMLIGIFQGIAFVTMYWFILYGGFTKITSKKIKARDINIRFDDVIGIEQAKTEAWEMVELIKDRAKLKKIGGKILRGILMVGPPGCGKTYLAKAISTEAKVPFLAMASSEFNEVFVGVGASRIRKLFRQARMLAYAHGACIIFIDELDAIGRSRTFSFLGGSETNATQNQLLVEMDGLKEKDYNVIVIGATNAAENVLDLALLRPGRFDRKIYIHLPNLEGREKLFQYYLSKVKYDPSIDIGRLARKAVYKSPADIENIIKEAALIATRYKKDIVSYKEITEAMERIDMGIKHKRNLTPQEREMVAYHESGHLLVLYILHPTDDVFKASIVSRGAALGVVHHQPREELFTYSRERVLAEIKVALGGYIAERLQCGVTSTGVSSDFKQAMHWAHDMVWMYGMGIGGYVGDYTLIDKSEISEKIKEKLNEESNQILRQCLKEVEELLVREKTLLDRFAKELLARDELEYDEIEAIFAEYGKSNIRSKITV